MRKLFVLLALLFVLDSRIAKAQDDCPAGAIRNPLVSSIDHEYMVRAFKASFRGIKGYEPSMKPGAGIEDGEYYIAASNHYGVYGDGQCHAGWSGYWESWIRVGHGDLTLVQSPAQFLPTVAPPSVPDPIPTPAPAPLPTTPTCDGAAMTRMLQMINTNVTEGREDNRAFYKEVGIQWKKISVFAAKYGSAILAGFLTHQATK